MLARIRKAREEEGFTLIELLVVIIIIGILAAIAIPVFLNQRKKGWDSAIKSDLRNLATIEETYNTDSGKYTADITQLTASGAGTGTGLDFKYSATTNYDGGTQLINIKVYDQAGNKSATANTGSGVGGYCLDAKSASNQVWQYDSTKGGLQPKTAGAC